MSEHKRHDWRMFDGAPSADVVLRYCKCGVIHELRDGAWRLAPVTLDRAAIQLLKQDAPAATLPVNIALERIEEQAKA